MTCNKCNSVYAIPKEKGKALENREKVEIGYWDLQEMHTEYYNNNYFERNICRNCGKKLEPNFTYCPYCGKRINAKY